MKKFYLTMLLSLLFCSVSWADGFSQSKTFGATGNPNSLLSNIVSSNYSFTQGAVTITTSNAKYDDDNKGVKVSAGSSLTVSVSSNCVITNVKVYAEAGSGSSKISLTETNDTKSFTDKIYHDQEWTDLASKNLQSVTLSAVDYHVYIQSVTVSYNYQPATVTAPKTWDFTESGDWTTAVSELSADNMWNKTYDNTTFKEARPNSNQASTYYYDLDMISGLGFTATKNGYPCLDQANHQLWLGEGATLTLPSLEASQRYRITTTDNNSTALTVDGTSITSGQQYTVSKAGNVVLTATGNVWIKKIEILKSASETEASWTYSSKDDADYKCKSYTASIDNTDGGIITAGKVFSGLPGLDFSFGTTGEANWSVGKYYDRKENERSSNIFVQGPAKPTLDGVVPTSGAFLTLKPVVNGKVTIHFFGWDDNYRWITQNEKGAKLTTLDKNGSNDDRTVTYTVYGGQTYFFYCSVSNNFLLGVNSITFEPSFYLQYAKTQLINDVTYEPLTLGVKYDMPFITTTAIPSDRGSISKYDESIGNDIYVLDGGGSISMIKSTTGNVGAKCVIKNSQFGDVTLSYHYTGIKDNKNVWMAYEGFTPKVGDQVTSENGGVTLTFGGWKYGTWTTAANKKITDEWSAGSGDDAGRDDDNVLTRIIDGFAYETSGNENGYSETKGMFEVGKTHTIPCRGAYAMFEPTKSGSLSIYILQNGAINNFKDENNVSTANTYGWTGHAGDFAGNLALRTFYIVDENGTPVSATPEINNVLRWNQAELNQLAKAMDKNITYYINKVDGTHENMDQATFDNIFTELNTTREKGKDISVVVHQYDNGYAVVQKSYVKYTFDVKPGKTYFIFSNSSKLGICGFKFEADETQATATKELANSGDYTAETDKTYASVTLKGRTFTQNQWTTLCLPFSVSASQMKKTFGDGVQLVEMDHVTTTNNETYDGTTYFYKTILMKNHVYNQMLVAGVPYLIKPDKTVTGATFTNVYFPSTAVNAGTVSVADNYTWRGTYGNVNTLGNGDYYVSGKTGQFKYYTTEGHKSNNFRAYLDFNSSTGAKPVVFEAMSVGGEETATGIETIKVEELDPTEFNTGAVYNLNGQMVSGNSKDLNNLPAGIYIVNGKKYVVK